MRFRALSMGWRSPKSSCTKTKVFEHLSRGNLEPAPHAGTERLIDKAGIFPRVGAVSAEADPGARKAACPVDHDDC